MLSAREVESFIEDGYVAVPGAVPADVVRACREMICSGLARHGVTEDPGTWTEPVVRIACPEGGPFAEAGTRPALWEAFDQLIGAGRWWRRPGVGGTIPVRFPSLADPGDAGWHIDGSFSVGDDYWVNVRSRERGLLVLFLLTDVSERDAPTELKVGSHLDVPGLLEPFGDEGTSFGPATSRCPRSTFERQSAFATGEAGDVFICHPFLVHRATWPHTGTTPRAIAQPGIAIHEPFRLEEGNPYPVERAILNGLGRRGIGVVTDEGESPQTRSPSSMTNAPRRSLVTAPPDMPRTLLRGPTRSPRTDVRNRF